MILFWLLAGFFVVAIMFQVLRPLWFGEKARSDEHIPVAVYRERLQRLERDIAAGRLDAGEAERVREQLGREMLEQVAEADQPGKAARHRPMAIIVSVLVAGLAIGTYLFIGNPVAVTPAEHVTPDSIDVQTAAPSMREAVESLERKLQENPDNVEDLMLLGRSYAAMDRWEDAAAMIGRALELAPDRAEVYVDYAEAVARVQGATLAGEPRRLLERALELDPGNAKAVWLLGMALYQERAFGEAADLWEGLLSGIPVDNPARDSLARQIADARQLAGQVPDQTMDQARDQPPSQPTDQTVVQGPVTTPAPETAAAGGLSLNVTVQLAPELAGQLAGTETLFVYARASNGPAMPLSIAQLAARQFPVTVTLDESMAMTPQMTLSRFPEVVVVARISRSGGATAQPGDLQALSDPLSPAEAGPVTLVIDQVIQ